ncbi:MAG: hemerythrin domain-containing protein [Nitrospiria bacterium]
MDKEGRIADRKEIDHDPIRTFKSEHRETLRKSETAKHALRSLRDLSENPVPERLGGEYTRLRDLVVSLGREICLHFQKEEEALFPVLEEYIGKEHGPIEVMLHEHEEIRSAFRDWEKMVVDLCETTEPRQEGILKAVMASGNEAIRLYRQHVSKENQILYKITEASLSAEEKRTVAERIKSIDIRRAGSG